MQKSAEQNAAPRFYHVLIQQDLLGGWTLVREWGNQGSAGRVKKQHFINRDEAEHALLESRDDQLDRGYKVVFLEGFYH
jgi:predicted DNA-binding WGR domain protein